MGGLQKSSWKFRSQRKWALPPPPACCPWVGAGAVGADLEGPPPVSPMGTQSMLTAPKHLLCHLSGSDRVLPGPGSPPHTAGPTRSSSGRAWACFRPSHSRLHTPSLTPSVAAPELSSPTARSGPGPSGSGPADACRRWAAAQVERTPGDGGSGPGSLLPSGRSARRGSAVGG